MFATFAVVVILSLVVFLGIRLLLQKLLSHLSLFLNFVFESLVLDVDLLELASVTVELLELVQNLEDDFFLVALDYFVQSSIEELSLMLLVAILTLELKELEPISRVFGGSSFLEDLFVPDLASSVDALEMLGLDQTPKFLQSVQRVAIVLEI